MPDDAQWTIRPADARERLRRRYLSLGLGELAAAIAFAVIAVTTVGPRLSDQRSVVALWCALAPLLLVLVQAGVYWLAARSWVGEGAMPGPLATAYRVFRLVDVGSLAAGLVGVVWFWPAGPGAATLVAGVWFFGVVEYVNYFVVRLAYPATRWLRDVTSWRTPTLVRDLQERQAAVRVAR